MTYRERRLAKAERLREWAAKRERDAAAVFKAGEPYTTDHAFNTQPGHIPFRARLIAREHRAFESINKARDMAARAAGIESAADRAVYSDDEDAVERLEERIAENEKKRDRMKLINGLFRKGDAAGLEEIGLDLEKLRARIAEQPAYDKTPFPGYALTNLGACIRKDRQRATWLKEVPR